MVSQKIYAKLLTQIRKDNNMTREVQDQMLSIHLTEGYQMVVTKEGNSVEEDFIKIQIRLPNQLNGNLEPVSKQDPQTSTKQMHFTYKPKLLSIGKTRQITMISHLNQRKLEILEGFRWLTKTRVIVSTKELTLKNLTRCHLTL